ncbi:MAG TPA: DUF6308 family protein [Acidimicrobiales bacterium]|nr:DUF6308 family protein [Acidimicrobiales bacterium]
MTPSPPTPHCSSRGLPKSRPREDLRAYFREDHRGYTGSWFERIVDSDHPNRITPRDVAAVATLSVKVPAHVTIWLLGDGAERVRALREQIPVDQAIWDVDADLGPDGPAEELWQALRKATWAGHSKRMGFTKTSKLLAAKRPHLIPIYDSGSLGPYGPANRRATGSPGATGSQESLVSSFEPRLRSSGRTPALVRTCRSCGCSTSSSGCGPGPVTAPGTSAPV